MRKNTTGNLDNTFKTHLFNTSDNALTTKLEKNADNKIMSDNSIDYSSLDPFNSDNI